jgi:hypothetical protein
MVDFNKLLHEQRERKRRQSMGGFGEPQVGDPNAVAGAAAGAGAVPGSEPQEMIDPNDPRLTSETLDVNTEADAYAQPAPPPDGKYRVKLKLVQQEDLATKEKKDYIVKLTSGKGGTARTPYYAASIEARIIDPTGKYDNIPVYDPWVGTFLNRDGSTKVSTILRKLVKADGSPWAAPGLKLNQKDWMDLFVKALQGEPEVGIETQWEWNCQPCGEEAKEKGTAYPKSIQGMQKFPVDADKTKVSKVGTVYQPELKCQVNPAHMFSRARPRIARFLSLSELK